MKRAEVLDDAKQKVTVDRAADHGDMEDNFKTIATYWSEHLDHKVTPIDVGIMMTLLKMARAKGNPYHQDNYVDGCGYLACAGELVDTDG
jgi:hypothetical protein